MKRRECREVKIGPLKIGGDNPIVIQSMLNRRSDDIEGSCEQAKALEAAGCQVIRAAVPRIEDAPLITALKKSVSVPIVADIHFDYKIAIECVKNGVDKIRINPGNIGSKENVRKVVDICRGEGVPIRIGVNSGSVEKSILAKHGGPTAEALCESALYHAGLLEELGFYDTVLSMKSSSVQTTIEAYRLAAKRCDYPLHLGVTEAGTERMGIIKSSAGIGSLLCDGIGDTIRVSLTADPVKEVYAARDLLSCLGLSGGIRFISCPTCGRTRIDVIGISEKVTAALSGCDKDITVAVMGCAVNGPGEAREADIGIAGGDGCALIFKKGEILRKVSEERIVDELIKEIEAL